MVHAWLMMAVAPAQLPAFPAEWSRLVAVLPADQRTEMRSGSWAFCSQREGNVDACMLDQDTALVGVAQAEADIAKLTRGKDYIVKQRAYCWSIYTENGARDLRTMRYCLDDLVQTGRTLQWNSSADR
jgi:hypothetical protein